MAKLFASEACEEVALEAMRVLGEGMATLRSFRLSVFIGCAPHDYWGRHERNSELVIARNLLKKYRI